MSVRLTDVWDDRPRRMLACQACGVRDSSDAEQPRCAFCAGTTLAEIAPPPAAAEPLLVMPFTIPQAEAADAARAWVRSQWFVPRMLRDEPPVMVTAVFLPLWHISGRSVTRYRGSRGHEWTSSQDQWLGPGPRHTTHTMHVDWTTVSGTLTWSFDGFLEHAVLRPATTKLEGVAPWRIAPVPAEGSDRLEAIPGCQVLVPEIERGQAWRRFHGRAIAIIRRECYALIGGDQQTLEPVRPAWDNLDQHLVLTPLWVFTFVRAGRRGRTGRATPVLMHARTGRLAWGGGRPVAFQRPVLRWQNG